MALKEITYRGTTFAISYEILNPTAQHDFIVLHGWGSNKEIMKGAFGDTLPDLRHIYIDLPGFGKSPNETILTTRDYANIIDTLLSSLHVKKEIVAGHSFGGKVATLLNPDMLVLLSSAGIPVPKPLGVRTKIALFKLFKALGLGRLRTYFASKDASGMSHEMYETFKNVVDEDFTDIFAQRDAAALLFWGSSDTATPLFTGEKIHKLISRSNFYPLEGDHFFFSRHAPFIAQTISQEFHRYAD